ncbi:bifunctional diguanylate cyclase/phosphodiesterase [bacterium]|nr:bifunctional diguanylate cyclase/phosphodiesterase [bacterium]MBU1993449.1 bifunctional diguanylate cyclase/phosphodiesterase [bacterium]
MKLGRLLSFVLIVGITSSVAIVYFYFIQREFSQNHREFLLSINKLENTQNRLTYLILQSSVYAYHNQDEIADTINSFTLEFNHLQNSNILKDDSYAQIKNELMQLEQMLTAYLQDIENYLMLNAEIKNSIVFLTRHVDNASFLQKEDKDIYIKANQILKQFHDAKRMQDLDYLQKSSFLLDLTSNNNETKKFIHNFNNHSDYLTQKYPLFVTITKKVLNNDIRMTIHHTRKTFSYISINDFKALDIFASILFSVFIFALLIIVTLFLKYIKENKNLLKTKESLEYSLKYDILTNLGNRNALETELKSLGDPYILVINIDGFKHINDIYGNGIGNRLLQELANLISAKVMHVRHAKAYRLGGDEFGILFHDTPRQKVLSFAHSLIEEISQKDFMIQTLELHLLVSVVSNNTFPILENADLALKLLKKDHAKRFLEYKESLNLKKSVQENLDTVEKIKNAIANDRIVPFYQPIINLQTLKIEKYEALVRLKLQDGTFLAPYKFLETSKKTPYYREITTIMVEKVLKELKEHPSLRFSINMSMIDILDEEIVNMLLKKLKDNAPTSSRLDIELLESENLQNISKVQNFIEEVKKFGCKILIDDFGSGYSNFSYFSDLNVDMVKIDGSIVNEITTNERKLHMLTSMYQFSQGMGMQSIAEFVETKETALLLRELGVEYGQGYYCGKPLEKPLESDEIII